MEVVVSEVRNTVEVVEVDSTVEVVEQVTDVVEVIAEGPQGSAGPQGPQGETGPQGPAGDPFAFVWEQASPSATWVIVHNLGAFLNATVVDSAGSQVEGEVLFQDGNTIVISFAGPFSGRAFIS